MEHEQIIQREIEELLRQKIGLNPDSLGSRSIMRSVKRGMRTGKMQGLSDYLSGLQTSSSLFERLVESIVVPETSFFRNRASFSFLRQWVSQEWMPSSVRLSAQRSPGRKLRVLSIPCSTGEEPYSIAITLLEEGLQQHEFHIDAVDISALALAKAKEGVYSPYAFRRQTYRSDDKYFTLGVPEGIKGKRTTQRYYLADSVRQAVSFHQGNVLEPGLLAAQAPYDIVFCRNLLIYFDSPARDRTFDLLNTLLRLGGLLFVGYAETGLLDGRLYSPVPYPQTFAYRKQISVSAESADKSGAQSTTPSMTQSIAKRLAGASLPMASAAVKKGPTTSSSSEHSVAVDSVAVDKEVTIDGVSEDVLATLAVIQQLADKGEIEQAVIECDRYLSDHPTVALAHLLRGELHQAIGDDAAAEACFEKALYLDTQLGEALTHLMLLKEANQDFAGAAVIRARLQRLLAMTLS